MTLFYCANWDATPRPQGRRGIGCPHVRTPANQARLKKIYAKMGVRPTNGLGHILSMR